MRIVSLTAGSTRLRVLLGGEGSPVVLLHGLGASLEWWEQAAGLMTDDHQVVAPDFPGHGLSDEPRGSYSLQTARQSVQGLLDALGLETATLVGNSMGGLIALSYTIRQPERVAALVLVASAGFGRALSLPLRLATFRGVGEAAVRFVRREHSAYLVYGDLFYDRRRLSRPWLRRVVQLCRRPSYPKAFLGCLRHGVDAGGLRQSIVNEVRQGMNVLTMPVLLLWGRQDNVVPLNQATQAVPRLPRARLEILQGCGHVPQVELPGETARAVLNFLAQSCGR